MNLRSEQAIKSVHSYRQKNFKKNNVPLECVSVRRSACLPVFVFLVVLLHFCVFGVFVTNRYQDRRTDNNNPSPSTERNVSLQQKYAKSGVSAKERLVTHSTSLHFYSLLAHIPIQLKNILLYRTVGQVRIHG